MRDHNLCFYVEISKIIPKLSLLPLLIRTTDMDKIIAPLLSVYGFDRYFCFVGLMICFTDFMIFLSPYMCNRQEYFTKKIVLDVEEQSKLLITYHVM